MAWCFWLIFVNFNYLKGGFRIFCYPRPLIWCIAVKKALITEKIWWHLGRPRDVGALQNVLFVVWICRTTSSALFSAIVTQYYQKGDVFDWSMIVIESISGLTVDFFIVKCWPFHWEPMLTVSLHIWPTAAAWLEDRPGQPWQSGWLAKIYLKKGAAHCKLIYLKKKKKI